MKKGDREKLRALIIQAVRDWNELNTDVPLTSYIAEWLLVNNLDFTVTEKCPCCGAEVKGQDSCPNCKVYLREVKE